MSFCMRFLYVSFSPCFQCFPELLFLQVMLFPLCLSQSHAVSELVPLSSAVVSPRSVGDTAIQLLLQEHSVCFGSPLDGAFMYW